MGVGWSWETLCERLHADCKSAIPGAPFLPCRLQVGDPGAPFLPCRVQGGDPGVRCFSSNAEYNSAIPARPGFGDFAGIGCWLELMGVGWSWETLCERLHAECKAAIPDAPFLPCRVQGGGPRCPFPSLPSATRRSRVPGAGWLLGVLQLQIGVVAEGCIVDGVGGEELEECWLGGLGAKLEVAAEEVICALVAGG